jgi:hypothetical protein
MKCSSRWWCRVRASRRAAILGGLALLAAGCAEASFTGLDPYYGVLVLPDTLQLRVGSSAALHAGVWLPEGMPRTLAWSTTNETVVKLEFPTDSAVLVVARAVGKASVLATVVADPASKSAAEVQVSP